MPYACGGLSVLLLAIFFKFRVFLIRTILVVPKYFSLLGWSQMFSTARISQNGREGFQTREATKHRPHYLNKKNWHIVNLRAWSCWPWRRSSYADLEREDRPDASRSPRSSADAWKPVTRFGILWNRSAANQPRYWHDMRANLSCIKP